ncbi:MAG: copper resistance protein CopC, partial [Dehalococcoidia bacterium]
MRRERRPAVRHRVLISLVGALIIGLAGSLLLARGASAHAVLVRSDPPEGARLEQSPKTINLWFSEALARDLTSARLLDATKKVVPGVSVSYNDADAKQLTLSVPKLPQGTYVVAWSSFSSVDGHRLDGSFSFGVGVAPPGASTSSATSPDYRPSIMEVAAQWVSLLGALAAGGMVTLVFLYGRPEDGAPYPRRAFIAVGAVSLVAVVAGGVATLLLRAHDAGGLGAAGEIISGSAWGHLWVARMVLAGVAAAVCAAAAVRPARFRQLIAALAGVIAGILLTDSLSSHAAAWSSNLPVAADFVHLVASAAWIGAVFGLAVLLLWSRRDPSGGRRTFVVRGIRRFAWVAVGSFALILLTGIYRTVEEMPTLRSFVDTTYGKALTAKLALVVVVLVLGAANFLVARGWDRRHAARPWRMLQRSLPLEALAGAAILAAVALMTLATPASSLLSRVVPGEAARITRVIREHGSAGDLVIDLTIQPAASGEARISAQIQQTCNNPNRPCVLGKGLGITQVRFRFQPLDAPVGESRVIAHAASDDTYAVTGPYLPFKGRWKITVDVRRSNADDASAGFVVNTVSQRPAYQQVLARDTVVYSVAEAAGDPRILVAASGAGFLRSTDGGLSWSAPYGSSAYHVVADPSAPAAFLAAAWASLLKSTDGGQTWVPVFEQPGNGVNDIAIDPADPRVMVIAAQQGIYASGDGGATWKLRLPAVKEAVNPGGGPNPLAWTAVTAGPGGTFLAGRRPGVLAVSRDVGVTWQAVRAHPDLPGGVMSLLIDPQDPARWFVGSMGSGVWMSDNAGDNWTRAKTAIVHGSGFAVSGDGDVYVATTGQGVFQSRNGIDWSPVG